MRTTVTLSEEVSALVEKECGRRGVTPEQLVENVLEREFCPRDQLAFIGALAGYGPPFVSDAERILEEHWADDILRDRG